MTAAPAVLTTHGASRSGVAWSLSGTGAHRSTWGQVHRADAIVHVRPQDVPGATEPECSSTTNSEGVQMSDNENVTATDRRRPDPVAPIWPFRAPWIAGDNACGGNPS